MKELILHCDYVRFKATQKTKVADDVPDSMKSGEMKDCLFVRMAVEKDDEGFEGAVVQKAVDDLKSVASQVKVKRILVYPYVHLLYGSQPGSMDSSKKILNGVAGALKAEGFEVLQAPFGWYKEFEVKVKGHPLAELSRIIRSTEKDAEDAGLSKALKDEKKLVSKWYVLDVSGKRHPIKIENGILSGFDFSKYPNLEKFAHYEMEKSRAADREPPHVAAMQKLELADYEPGSDQGNLRYYPKGRLIRKLLEDWVSGEMIRYGAMEVETPIMYDLNHPTLKKYLNRFPARQYIVKSANKDYFLRFAACFGQFLMAHDATISYRHLPLRLYEMTKYSFRLEKSGELTGLRRLRTFTMPDCHAMCADEAQAKEEYLKRMELAINIQKKIGLNLPDDLELAIRVVEDFYSKNDDLLKKMVNKWGKPALLETWDDRFFYFIIKYELNFVDALNKASALTTDQIDVENSTTYDITYVDEKGEKRRPLLLHLSPSGAIERVMYALLEKACMEEGKKKVPELPLWLSPTQVRLCPIADRFNDATTKIADALEKSGIRVDIDDRTESIGKKVRDAELEWVPYIVVIGEKEIESKKLATRIRRLGKVEQLSPKELSERITKETEGMPFRPISLPRELTKRPTFRG
ncbi:MAG: threonine--tRNA ligase [archaeon]